MRPARWRGCAAIAANLFDPNITEHKFRVVKNTCDGTLVKFSSG